MWRTSRLFAREVASIDPQWLEDLAKHLIQKRASLPVYSEKSQEVVCTETHYLYSYPIAQYPNRSYLAYNPEQATLLFVTQALTQPEMITTLLEEELFAFYATMSHFKRALPLAKPSFAERPFFWIKRQLCNFICLK